MHLKGEGTVLVQAFTGLTGRGVGTAFVDSQEGEWKQTDSGVWQEDEEKMRHGHEEA